MPPNPRRKGVPIPENHVKINHNQNVKKSGVKNEIITLETKTVDPRERERYDSIF